MNIHHNNYDILVGLKIINFMGKENKILIDKTINMMDIMKMERKLMEKWNGYKEIIICMSIRVPSIKMDSFMAKVIIYLIILHYFIGSLTDP